MHKKGAFKDLFLIFVSDRQRSPWFPQAYKLCCSENGSLVMTIGFIHPCYPILFAVNNVKHLTDLMWSDLLFNMSNYKSQPRTVKTLCTINNYYDSESHSQNLGQHNVDIKLQERCVYPSTLIQMCVPRTYYGSNPDGFKLDSRLDWRETSRINIAIFQQDSVTIILLHIQDPIIMRMPM